MLEKTKTEKYNPWSLEYDDYDPKKEKSRESLLTVGNGYFGTFLPATRNIIKELFAVRSSGAGFSAAFFFIAKHFNMMKIIY